MSEPMRLDPALRGRGAEILVQAFLADPLYAYIFQDAAERPRALRGLWDALIRFTLVYGEAWTTPQVNGLACWLAPGHTGVTFWQMLRTGFVLPRATLQFSPAARRRFTEVEGYLDAQRHRAMPGPHYWYLWALGVTPASQGQGVGSRLLAPVLARADAAGVPCYLETESELNVKFYRKHGFEVLTAEPPPGHDLMLWTMLRKAA